MLVRACYDCNMNGVELAEAVRAATGGNTRALPCDPRWPAFGVAIAPGGCVVLVRDHGGMLTASVGRRAWHVTIGQGMPLDLPGQAKQWATAHADESTLTDAAVTLGPVLDREMSEHWVLSIPGGQPAPTEMWLHPQGDNLRGSVGIFATSIHIGEKIVPMARARRFASTCTEVVQRVREQRTAYARNVTLSEECKRLATDLAARLGKSTNVSGSQWPTYSSAVIAAVVDGTREVARVSARDGTLFVDAGLPGDRGWHGAADQATGDGFEALVRAIAKMDGAVTYDSLAYNHRYRVLLSYRGLRAGEIVTYGGPIDNHAPHTFMNDKSEETLIEEHDLRENADRLFARA